MGLTTGQLFGREAAVTMTPAGALPGTVAQANRYVGLRCKFRVERSLRPEPNKCEVTLTNLAAATRAQIAVVKSNGKVATPMRVLVEAGYQGQLQVLFTGDVRHVVHAREGVDWNTQLQCHDGGAAWAGARTSCSFAPGAPVASVIRKLVADLGVDEGNLSQALASGQLSISTFEQGFTGNGLASRQLNRVLAAAGLNWSIQDGALQLLAPKATTQTSAYLLSASTGLVGAPEPAEQDPRSGSFLKVKTLLLPALRPGMAVQLNSVSVQGLHKIQKAIHSGDTHGHEWYSELELVRLS